MFLVGHVTKQGDIAGPRVLEHIVDAVLYMEGERHQTFRLLRGIKNRYGATDEVGITHSQDSKELMTHGGMCKSGSDNVHCLVRTNI